ncbi:cyclin-dependent kinase 11B-like isoform X3 [Homarus americanus]|uniref:cyclin-dependent kinase 11B-like isoform X3 n=1 Tax=Homarus americanus TaxID=6706 RepID=UPI001C4807E7|nr:cyclin-dependent kinase 11B-like isoform X3 [Homarus americanus]
MDSHEEDGEIRDEGRHHPQISIEDNEVEEDEFSMSSYDGDQGDSLDIKPPQAVVQRREKREKRDKRDRHRHKAERHKERHRNRDHRNHDHRRHRERSEVERRENREVREARRHGKRHERGNKPERPVIDLRSKVIEKGRKMADRDRERRRGREREEYYVDEREQYDSMEYHREHQGRGGMGGGMGENEYAPYPHHRREVQLSPRERAERDRRRDRFLVAEEAEEVTIVSDEEEEGEYEENLETPVRKGSKERRSDEEGKKKKKKEEVRTVNQVESGGSDSSDSESDSERARSPTPPQRNQYHTDSDSSETDVEEEEKDEDAVKKEKDSGDQMSLSGSGSGSARSGTLSPNEAGHYQDSPTVEDCRSDREEANYLPDSSPESPLELKDDLPAYYPAIMGCRSVDEFECLNRIEEGTYGVVYRAREKATNQIVALKRLKMEKEKEGFPITSLREVNTLLKGQHENIVTVREIVVGSNMDKIYIVMDYVEHDLKSLMETMRQKKQMFTIGEVKTLMRQLLRAVHHLHDNWILHRDLKTSNLLLSHRGILKVGDFGLAREYGSPLKHYTPIVVTLWYRAPELLLGAKQYSTHIDVWSVGCIFGELLGMEPMFPGKSEIDQLNKIFKDLGTPSEKIWPGYSQLPLVKKTQFADYPYNHLRERFKTRLSDQGFSLLNRFLTYNPPKRITCQEAVHHDYFHKEAPAPVDPAMFPTWPAKSENPHGRSKKVGLSPKPPSGGKNFKDLVDGDEELAARGFFLGGASSSGPGFVLKM